MVKNTLRTRFLAKGRIARFFKKNELNVEYDIETLKIAPSIASLPLISNVLPLVWAMDAELYVDRLDKQSKRSFEVLREVFRHCYPDLVWGGNLVVGDVVDHAYHNTNPHCLNGCLVFFSGGVDSLATYFRHREEGPILVTVWGADCDLQNTVAWNRIWAFTKKFSERTNTKAIWIRSDFKKLLNYSRLNLRFQSLVNTNWWSAVQYALGLFGLGAPLAHALGAKRMYLSSSWWPDAKYYSATSWGPHCKPWFGQCQAIIDAWELSRQEKLRLVLSHLTTPMEIRVCWQSPFGENCGKCEKCSRTILALEIEGFDPNMYGFHVDDNTFVAIMSQLEKSSWLSVPSTLEYWRDIQRNIRSRPYLNPPHEGAARLCRWLIKIDLETLGSKKSFSKNVWGCLAKYLASLPPFMFEGLRYLYNLVKCVKQLLYKMFSEEGV
jgi:bacterioferritin-associated ferredoxin